MGNESSYRWVVLGVVSLTVFVGGFTQFMVAPWGAEIAQELGFAAPNIAGIVLAPMIVGVLFSLPGGTLADRFGVKKVLTAALIVATLGAFLRIWADSYGMLFFSMFLSGASGTLAMANSPKILSAWFKPESLGLAFGIFMAGGGLGSTIGMAVARLFPTYGQAFWVSAFIMLAVLILWVLLLKDRPEGVEAPPRAASAISGLASVIKLPHVWLLGAGMAFFTAANMTYSSLLPTGLQADKGMTPAQAGVAASVIMLGSLLGSLGAPIALKISRGLAKPVILSSGIAGGVFLFLAWFTAPNPVFMLFLCLGGISLAMAMTVIMSGPSQLPEVTLQSVGAAGGLISTVQMAGAFAIPTWIITPIGGGNYTLIFLLGSLCSLLITGALAFIPEFSKARQGANN